MTTPKKPLLKKRWVQVTLIAFAVMTAAGLYLIFGRPDKTLSSSTPSENTPEILKPVRESSGNSAAGNASGTPSGDENTLSPVSEDAVPPGMEQLKEELENGPPAKGPSIVRYAEKLTDKMGDAEENPAKVPEVFKELERCMRGEAQEEAEAAMELPAVKAMCLFNAGELAQQYPEYKERHRKLTESASQQVKDILKYTEGE